MPEDKKRLLEIMSAEARNSLRRLNGLAPDSDPWEMFLDMVEDIREN